ncbi:hypothetical protein M8332_00245 [Fructilactobacillus ixorae]|uniref:Uncharacterized protein n=1 Tax=Fructilactobacillus ixorae TaxID=1750535 RepID=A0ABY5C3H7_9LACO|nr:hypothetical protein [Fructilactobacillus ixorae]USS93335.1 hypothetical protein M8332_00245 [Fructilactobacillus ixorae]
MAKFMKRMLITGIILSVSGLVMGVIGFYGGGRTHGLEKAYSHTSTHMSLNFSDDDDGDDDY